MKLYLSHKQRSAVWLSWVNRNIIYYELDCNFDRIGVIIGNDNLNLITAIVDTPRSWGLATYMHDAYFLCKSEQAIPIQ